MAADNQPYVKLRDLVDDMGEDDRHVYVVVIGNGDHVTVWRHKTDFLACIERLDAAEVKGVSAHWVVPRDE